MMNTAIKELSEDEFKKLQGLYQAQFGITMNKQVLLLFEAQKNAHLQELELIQNLFQQQKKENAALYQKQIEVLNQKINQDKQQHENYTASIERAVVAIGNQKGAIITDNPKVVVHNNVSKYGIIGLVLLLLSGLGAFTYDHYYDRQEEYRKITNTLIAYPKIYKFEYLAQKASIVANPDEREGEYIELTVPKQGEEMVAGKHYIYDQKNERILVPLHFSKTPFVK